MLELSVVKYPDILFYYEGLLEALIDLSFLERYWPAERSLGNFFDYVYSEEPYDPDELPFQYIAKDKGSLLFQSIYIHCQNEFTPNELKKVLEEFEEFHKTNKSVIQPYSYYSSIRLSDAPLEILQNCPPDDELAVADLIRTLGNIGNKKAIEEITLYLENDYEKIRTAAKEALKKLE